MPGRGPVRTCAGCRGRAEKGSLLRIVRSVDGTVAVDSSGSARGRGAYVHREPACADAALTRGFLLRALRAGVDVDGAARLRAAIEQELRRD